METSNDWMVRSAADYPPDGIYELRLESIRKRNLGFGPRLQFEWSFVDHPAVPTFGTLTTQSMRRSNALGLVTALSGGTPPVLPLDLRPLVGRQIRAKTRTNKSSFPALVAVRPADPTSPFVYELQIKKATASTEGEPHP